MTLSEVIYHLKKSQSESTQDPFHPPTKSDQAYCQGWEDALTALCINLHECGCEDLPIPMTEKFMLLPDRISAEEWQQICADYISNSSRN